MRDRRFSYSLTIEGVVFDITPITDSLVTFSDVRSMLNQEEVCERTT